MSETPLEKEATEYAQKLGAKDFIAKPKEIVAYFGYLAGAEPREKKIAELEKEVTRLRNENLDIINKYTRFAETDRRTIAELEAENAELKEWKEQTIKARGRDYMDWSKMYEQFTKAKEIIKDMLRDIPNRMWYTDNVIKRAEDFIKE